MKVLKFGGTSLESPERIRAVIAILQDHEPIADLVVVVSAMSGVTDALTMAARVAASGAGGYQDSCASIESRHRAAAVELVNPAEAQSLIGRIERRVSELSDLLHGVSLVRECSPRSLDQISSYGERLSADLVAAALRKRGIDAEYADARRFIVTDSKFGDARVELEATERRIRDHFDHHQALQVVTGFLGATVDGETTTLGRGGSDYTAALLGSALAADRIEIWTDVNGVMSADPRLVASAFSLEELSLVIAREDEEKSRNAIHEALLGEPRRLVHLFVLGTGGVGTELLSQIEAQREGLRAKGLELRLSGLAASQTMRLSRQGLDFGKGKALLKDAPANDLDELARFIEATSGPRVLVDVTASPEFPDLYERLLTQGVAVVTANKLPLAGPMKDFERLHRHPRLYYETTAGAGLPVVRTLAGLVETGDKIERIEGVFSGTLSYLFNRIREGTPPLKALQEARDKGYTEPDPREDLSGMDVVRKLLILARSVGISIETEAVSVQSLVPDGGIECFGDTVADAQDRAPEGATLCYLAKLDNGRASVGLEAVDASHPAASLEATDNLFAFTTARYRETPLVIRGSGAGHAVTASGVFADILQACAELESR